MLKQYMPGITISMKSQMLPSILWSFLLPQMLQTEKVQTSRVVRQTTTSHGRSRSGYKAVVAGENLVKKSDISVSRALKFVKLCCDQSAEAEDDVLSSTNFIDYILGCPQLLTNFVDSLDTKWGIGQSGQIAYVTSISDLLDFRKFNSPPSSVLQNFAVTEVYVKRARKCLAKDMRSNWTTDLYIETLESHRSWASLP
ncbi:partial [Paramuricea clavata]|uniref:Partial n=1 Tax=Paramuricea clavata TaxID=317549 RepID=A0A7D9HLU4_PARCT|nr:partial [Paramuricea clavata]